MPHMMPMMWIMNYLFTLFFLMISTSLLYFFFLPTPKMIYSTKSKKLKKIYKWTWLW